VSLFIVFGCHGNTGTERQTGCRTTECDCTRSLGLLVFNNIFVMQLHFVIRSFNLHAKYVTYN